MSDSLQPHGLQHGRLPYPLLSLGVCSNSCPLIQWRHLISCHSFLLLPSVFSTIRVFSNESALWINAQNIEAKASVNIQGWFPLGLTGLISLLSKGFSRVFSLTNSYQIPQVQPEQNWTTSIQPSRPWSHSSRKAHERINKYNQYNDDNNMYMSHILSV